MAGVGREGTGGGRGWKRGGGLERQQCQQAGEKGTPRGHVSRVDRPPEHPSPGHTDLSTAHLPGHHSLPDATVPGAVLLPAQRCLLQAVSRAPQHLLEHKSRLDTTVSWRPRLLSTPVCWAAVGRAPPFPGEPRASIHPHLLTVTAYWTPRPPGPHSPLNRAASWNTAAFYTPLSPTVSVS